MSGQGPAPHCHCPEQPGSRTPRFRLGAGGTARQRPGTGQDGPGCVQDALFTLHLSPFTSHLYFHPSPFIFHLHPAQMMVLPATQILGKYNLFPNSHPLPSQNAAAPTPKHLFTERAPLPGALLPTPCDPPPPASIPAPPGNPPVCPPAPSHKTHSDRTPFLCTLIPASGPYSGPVSVLILLLFGHLGPPQETDSQAPEQR